MLRSTATAAACLALATGLSGLTACDDQPSTGPGDGRYDLRAGDTYVAIGDSYTAASKTSPPAKDDERCGQVQRNYPRLIAEETGATLRDNSCNGADTSHLIEQKFVWKEPDGERLFHPPQLEGLDEDTDLVTFRLGANDFKLIGSAFLCAQQFFGKAPGTCTALDRAAGPDGATQHLADLVPVVEESLALVREKAPNARIIVISYPQIFPPDGKCALLPLPDGDEAWARSIVDGLNAALAAGAESIDATYVDMFEASAGHDICSEEPWVAGAEVVRGGATKWHPYREESEVVAELVLDALEN
ncbi:SGNH/GDSL hydrolase family protein [Nocardioides stalactiti]|uniref:SGNH/GDSL hydrolase family protein n=1 Tax=Nocardioides stalactiti TaxID=2755356 RepID=UPI001602BC42|nr:SGNH/GDSL hydrolase family protein [Nocardioides stalactiti]